MIYYKCFYWIELKILGGFWVTFVLCGYRLDYGQFLEGFGGF
jgi:hypothetical protein